MSGQHSTSSRRGVGPGPWIFGALVLLCWHVAVATTSGVVGAEDLGMTVHALTRLHPLSGLPGDAPGQVEVLSAFALALVIGAVVGVWVLIALGRRHKRPSGKGMADKHDVERFFGEDRARASAERTRPALNQRERRKASTAEFGLVIGVEKSSRRPVVLSFEDHVAIYGASGSRKSNYLMVPAALSAPGALIVTSNEVSILDLIATQRAKKGRIWVFDPLGRAHWPEPMVWDPVAGCEDGEAAQARAIAFAAGLKRDSGSTNAGFFQNNAVTALKCMLHAAALSGRSMPDVLRWAVSLDTEARVPIGILRDSEDLRVERGWAGELESVSTGAEETVSSSRQTLQQAVAPLALGKVSRWVTPQAGVARFNAAEFVHSTDTLVLLSDDSSATNVGPLCTMLFQEVIDTIKAEVPLLPAMKLDPPLRLVGDEFANIAPIDKAPEMSSELRKLGVQWILAFQSERQAVMRWGSDRGAHLLEQMAAEILLPGLKSSSTLERFSRLSGRVDVDGHPLPGGGKGTPRERDVQRADQIRMLQDGQALLLWRNAPPAIIEMTAWYDGPDSDQLVADAKEVAARRRAHARGEVVDTAAEEAS